MDFQVNLPCNLDEELTLIEKSAMALALELSYGSKSIAAKLLGMGRTKFIFRLKRAGMFKYREDLQHDTVRRELYRYREFKRQASEDQQE